MSCNHCLQMLCPTLQELIWRALAPQCVCQFSQAGCSTWASHSPTSCCYSVCRGGSILHPISWAGGVWPREPTDSNRTRKPPLEWWLQGHMAESSIPATSPLTLNTYLLRNLACTLYQLLLGVGIAGAALQGSSLGDQGSTAMTQLLHPALDVGADLQRNVCVTESAGN